MTNVDYSDLKDEIRKIIREEINKSNNEHITSLRKDLHACFSDIHFIMNNENKGGYYGKSYNQEEAYRSFKNNIDKLIAVA